MTPKEYIEELEKAVEYCETHEDVPSDVYESYVGQLNGAQKMLRLIEFGV